jgi:hypothetical protein
MTVTYVADQRGDLDARRVPLVRDDGARRLGPASALRHDVAPARVRVVLARAYPSVSVCTCGKKGD